jgi:hypothetical protein
MKKLFEESKVELVLFGSDVITGSIGHESIDLTDNKDSKVSFG